VARAALTGLDGRVGDQLGRRPDDARAVTVEDDRPVHLRQLPQPRAGELDVQLEAAGADGLDGPVVSEHDQRAGATPQDALQAVAELGARGDRGERRAQRLVVPALHVPLPTDGLTCGVYPPDQRRPAVRQSLYRTETKSLRTGSLPSA